jgi:hypothetical protein
VGGLSTPTVIGQRQPPFLSRYNKFVEQHIKALPGRNVA